MEAEGGPASLTFLGHSTVLIQVDRLRILTDPFLERGLGPIRRQTDAVFARDVRRA